MCLTIICEPISIIVLVFILNTVAVIVIIFYIKEAVVVIILVSGINLTITIGVSVT